MLTISYLDLAVYSLGLAVLSTGVGVLLSSWWHRAPPQPWEGRSQRDWEGPTRWTRWEDPVVCPQIVYTDVNDLRLLGTFGDDGWRAHASS